MANTTIGTLAISVKANVGKAIAGFKAANKSIIGLSKSVARASRMFTAVGAAGLTAGTAIGTAMVKNSLSSVDALAKMSSRLGIATEDLIGLRHAAELSGVGITQLEIGLQRMTRRIAEAANGAGEAVGALGTLGLSAQTLSGMSPDKQFLAVADAMQQINGRSEQVRLTFKLFDSDGVGLLNTMNGGADAIRAAIKEAEELGLTFSNIDAAQIEAANDSVSKLQSAFSGLSNQITIGLAPAIDGIANASTNYFKKIISDIDLSGEAFKRLVSAMGLGADILRYLEIGWKSLQVVGSAAVAALFDVVTELSIGLETMLDELGLVERGWTQAMRNMRQALYETVEENATELQELWNAPMPGQQVEEQIKQWGVESRKAANEASRLKEILEEASITGPFPESTNQSVADLFSDLDKKLNGEIPILVQMANAGASVEQLAKAMDMLSKIDLKKQSDDLDAIADSLLNSIKSPTEALEDFIKEIETLGDRLTAFQKDQLISNKYDELFGDTFKQSTPQSPAALQQGTAAARSAEIAALNRFNNGSEDKRYQDKMIKLSQRSQDYLREIDRNIRDIERREGIEVVG